MAAMTSSNSNPTLLASTTNCSTSCCKIRFLSPARACGGSATRVPMPGFLGGLKRLDNWVCWIPFVIALPRMPGASISVAAAEFPALPAFLQDSSQFSSRRRYTANPAMKPSVPRVANMTTTTQALVPENAVHSPSNWNALEPNKS